jgi:hypothetical protein
MRCKRGICRAPRSYRGSSWRFTPGVLPPQRTRNACVSAASTPRETNPGRRKSRYSAQPVPSRWSFTPPLSCHCGDSTFDPCREGQNDGSRSGKRGCPRTPGKFNGPPVCEFSVRRPLPEARLKPVKRARSRSFRFPFVRRHEQACPPPASGVLRCGAKSTSRTPDCFFNLQAGETLARIRPALAWRARSR